MTDAIDEQNDQPVEDEAGLERLIEYLARSRGFDFSGYKRRSLSRRMRRRMAALEQTSFAEYQAYLESHPDEHQSLFDILLINVTSFFRDPLAWDAVAVEVRRLLADRPGDAHIRVWSAGCATGEEPYTVAMILAEELGVPEFAQRVKIYATDMDEAALRQARLASYKAKAVENVPPLLLEKYFTRTDGSFTFDKDLRRSVIFGAHDLVRDAPISRVDILICRNTLMYFNADTQTRILNRLHFGLTSDGVLFLGKAEMLLSHVNLFAPLDLSFRIFRRAGKGVRPRDRLPAEVPVPVVRETEPRRSLAHLAFDTSSIAQLVVDAEGKLAMVNHRAVLLLGLLQRDRGRPFHDLELSYRPAELRSHLDAVRSTHRAVRITQVERPGPGGERNWLDIEVAPLAGGPEAAGSVLITFFDVTQPYRLQQELLRSNASLEAAQQEIQSAGEELETTNEELQSTVEELETTNEELQSTNEELETINEELQSTNEELQTMNEELRERGQSLHRVSAFYSAVLGSMRSGVAVLSTDLVIQAWNPAMSDLWGLRSDEVEGKHFLNLDIGLPLDELRPALRACTSQSERAEVVLDCTNRRGRSIRCHVTVSPLEGTDARGVIVFIDEIGEK